MESSSKRTLPILLAIAAIAFTSGCIGQDALPVGANGLIVTNLFIDPPPDQVQTGEFITITADIENIGGATARNVVAELIGASWITPGIASQLPPGSLVLANFIGIDEENDGIPGTTLSPPDPRFGLPGQLKTITFRLPAPRLPEGQKATFNLKMRITYDYETSAVAQITGFSRERYNTLYQQGKITPPTNSIIPVQVSPNVPVTISVTGPDKIIAGPGLYEEYTYQFTFSNVGSNIPVTISPITGRPEDGLLLGTIWVTGPGVFWRQCLGIAPDILLSNIPPGLNNFFTNLQVQYEDRFSAWYQATPWGEAFGLSAQIGSIFLGVEQFPAVPPAAPDIRWPAYVLFPNAIDWEVLGFLMDPIKLRRGQSVTKSCTVGIINDPGNLATWAGRSEDSILINAQLKYRYFVDQDVAITVAAPLIRVPVAGPQ